MRAIVIREPGSPDVLELQERPAPVPGSRELLVRVHAAGVNRADLLQRRGHYPPAAGGPADIPGLEYAGIVEQIASDVTEWEVGDRVMGITTGGAYAEYVVVHEGEALPIPEHLDFTTAAAIPEAFITAHDALITRCHLRAGESVLIHAVASGVGTAAVQLARATGARVLGTARTPGKLARVAPLGLSEAIPATDEWPDQVLAATNGRGVDVILDLVGGDYLPGNIRALALRGRLIIVGLVAGRSAPLDMGAVLNKRLDIHGTVLRARPRDEKIIAAGLFMRDVFPLLAAGEVAPVVEVVLPLAAAAEAHELLESNGTVGKVVLRVEGEGEGEVARHRR